MEAFVYNRSSGYRSIVQKYGGSPSTSSWFWSMYNGQNQFYYYSGGNEPAVTSGQTHYNKWVHCAVSREGNTIRIFDNGELTGTLDVSSYDTMNDSTVPVDIGADYSDAYDMDGFISNVRIVKGTALYTSNFTPPSAPLTNVTNTKLLTCQTATTYQIAAVAPLVGGVNSGTVWSSSLTADSLFRSSSYPAKDAFNGVTKTSTEDCAATPQVAGQGFTFTFGEGVPFTTLQMQCDHNNGATVRANGVDITSQLSSGSLTNTTITGVSSPLTSLSVVSHNGDAGYLGSVTIDGTMLVDPVVPNGDAAATNFNPFNTDINTVRGQETGYCTFNPLKKSSEITLSNGNFDLSSSNTSNKCKVFGTFSVSTGKYYYEVTIGTNYRGSFGWDTRLKTQILPSNLEIAQVIMHSPLMATKFQADHIQRVMEQHSLLEQSLVLDLMQTRGTSRFQLMEMI